MIRGLVAFLIACGVTSIYLKRMPLLTLLGLELCLNGVLLALLARYSGAMVDGVSGDSNIFVITALALFALAVVETVLIATIQLRLDR